VRSRGRKNPPRGRLRPKEDIVADIERSKAGYLFDGMVTGVLPAHMAADIRALLATDRAFSLQLVTESG
jgi:hypothetical protein